MSNDSEKKGIPKGLKVFFSFIGILLLVYVVWMLIYNSAFMSQRCCGGNGCTSKTEDACVDPCKWQRPNCSNPFAPWCSNFGLTQGWLGCEDGSNGNGKKCIDNPQLMKGACSNAPTDFKCSTESVCGTQKDNLNETSCCVLSEPYRRFNRSPRRREGYRSFARRR